MTKSMGAAILVSGIALSLFSFRGQTAANASIARHPRRPVVVELFTSEGCSSCPPADAFLSRLESEQTIQDVEVIALEQHVDYWNNLGWIDPFSSDFATIRQYAYAGELGNRNAYTPQMVIDGSKELVGGRERQARSLIEQAATEEKATVSITSTDGGANRDARLRVSVGRLVGASAQDTPEVWLAVTETGLHSDVKRGENAGEDLHHAAVVRDMRKIGKADGTGDVAFASDETRNLDRAWKPENVHFVVIVQEKKSRRILGAASTGLGR